MVVLKRKSLFEPKNKFTIYICQPLGHVASGRGFRRNLLTFPIKDYYFAPRNYMIGRRIKSFSFDNKSH